MRIQLCDLVITEHDTGSPCWPRCQPIIAIKIMKCRSMWPCSRLFWWAKATTDKPQYLKDAGQRFGLYYLYSCLHCSQCSLFSLALHRLGLISWPLASQQGQPLIQSCQFGHLDFKGIVYNLHWLDSRSKTTQRDESGAKNGFSVMLNKQKGREERLANLLTPPPLVWKEGYKL